MHKVQKSFSILFACKRFHQMVYGKRITVQTDNRPLVSVLKTGLSSCPSRMQSVLLQLSKYEFDIIYVRGKDIPASILRVMLRLNGSIVVLLRLCEHILIKNKQIGHLFCLVLWWHFEEVLELNLLKWHNSIFCLERNEFTYWHYTYT